MCGVVWMVCGWGWNKLDSTEWGGEQQARQDERLHCGRIEGSWYGDLVDWWWGGGGEVVFGGAR